MPDFYTHLEYKIGEMFQNLDLEETKGFWCDGVLPMDNPSPAMQKYSFDHFVLYGTAFLGKTGQERYLLKIHLGLDYLKSVKGDFRNISTLPIPDHIQFISIDTKKKKLEVRL